MVSAQARKKTGNNQIATMTEHIIQRGDIFFATLDPTQGCEIKKTRPVIVISNNAANQHSELVTVIPLTSNTKIIRSFEVFIATTESNLPKDSKAQCHQIRSITKKRLKNNPVGKITQEIIDAIEAALKLHLAIKI